MAISARSRRGTSPSFWRNHNAMQMMMAEACMPSVRRIPTAKADSVKTMAQVAPTWFPTPAPRDKYQARSNKALNQLSAR
ncbi:MAG TPA: hypothetical protein VMU57_17645 [Edaphobacter sp.]|uniref:hypothetical protein n=1 Tax=Edaphobacter sp. TaxID=1934404 RepID=UPI002C48249E|nr:hypothetical protein [Edaphobacter sp.]HUZ96730.1 hypothetical protein [Edaphobacter sp.]